MNKFLAVACVATVALVKGEADADAFYGVYGYGAYPYATNAYAGYPYSYGAYAYGAYPYAHAAYSYAAPVVTATAQVSPSSSLTTLGLADASIPAVAGGYAGAGRYVANSAGVVHVAKREAEAEAEAEADPALFYSAYGYAGYPYTAGYSAYPYNYGYSAYPYSYGYPYAYSSYAHVAAPAVAAPVVEAEATPAVATVAAAPVAAYHTAPVVAAPVATGYAQVSPSASLTTVGLADASIPAVAGGYAGAGRYVANSAGVVHVAKREAEAEAEADPALLYTSAYPYSYGYPYGYSAAYPYSYGYPYGAYGAHAYAGYPYAHYAAPVATATAQVSPSSSLTTLGLADASIPAVAGGYAGAGRYVANSAGVVHVA